MKFGVLTLATPNDYKKAIGLALSVRVSNPGIPIAVACSKKVAALVAPYFDHVVDEDPTLRGFVHKVHLDKYSPFDVTFFFDSDVLVFKDLAPIVQEWSKQPYTAIGNWMTDGFSSFGLDRAKVLRKINKPEMSVIDGAGHALFIKPQCQEVFDLARQVTREHKEYCGDIPYADEDVMDIVMTMLDLAPAPGHGFFSRYLSVTPGTLTMDASQGICEFVAKHSGELYQPCMMHFASNEAPFPYAIQLIRLFKKFGVPTDGLLKTALDDWWTMEVWWPAKARVKKWLRR